MSASEAEETRPVAIELTADEYADASRLARLYGIPVERVIADAARNALQHRFGGPYKKGTVLPFQRP